MQFSKIELPIRNPEPPAIVFPTYRLNGQKICKRCGIREAGGYAGNGVILSDLCLKCYRAAGRESKAEARNPKFYCLEGKS